MEWIDIRDKRPETEDLVIIAREYKGKTGYTYEIARYDVEDEVWSDDDGHYIYSKNIVFWMLIESPWEIYY